MMFPGLVMPLKKHPPLKQQLFYNNNTKKKTKRRIVSHLTFTCCDETFGQGLRHFATADKSNLHRRSMYSVVLLIDLVASVIDTICRWSSAANVSTPATTETHTRLDQLPNWPYFRQAKQRRQPGL